MTAIIDAPTDDRAAMARHRRHHRTRRVLAAIGLVVLGWVLFTYLVQQPGNDRDWEFGFERLPTITVAHDTLSVRDLRDFRLVDGVGVIPGYQDRTIRLQNIERAWFVVEPFQASPIVDIGGVAHTYFVFDVAGQPPVAVSVEARRERGERFDILLGMMNRYELMYVWATEEDVTIKRVVEQGNELYMFPLLSSRETTIHLVERLAESSAELERRPRFYNSLTSNCTNELAENANSLRPGAIPLSSAWWLPGYSVDQLYDLGYIPHDRPLPEIRQRFAIGDVVRQIYREPDFSELLRAHLDP